MRIYETSQESINSAQRQVLKHLDSEADGAVGAREVCQKHCLRVPTERPDSGKPILRTTDSVRPITDIRTKAFIGAKLTLKCDRPIARGHFRRD